MHSPFATIAFVLLAYASPIQASGPVDEVRSAIAEMNKAAAKLDAEEFMRVYWQSPDLTITFDGETMRGWAFILGEQRKWWSDKEVGVTFEEQRPAEVIVQDRHIVTSVQWMNVTNAAFINKRQPSLI